VDAIFTFEPYANQAVRLLGESAVRFPKTGMDRETFNLVARRDFAEKEPEILKRVLRGIDQAETFVQQNRQESTAIIAKKLKLEPLAKVFSKTPEFVILPAPFVLSQAVSLDFNNFGEIYPFTISL